MPTSIKLYCLAAVGAFALFLIGYSESKAQDSSYQDLRLRAKDATDVTSFFIGVLEFSSSADREAVPVSKYFRTCMAEGITNILPTKSKDTIARYIADRSDANLAAVNDELIDIHLSLAQQNSLQPISNRCTAEGDRQKYPQFYNVSTREAFIERSIDVGFDLGQNVTIATLKSCAVQEMEERYPQSLLTAIDDFIEEKSFKNFEHAMAVDTTPDDRELLPLLGKIWRDCR